LTSPFEKGRLGGIYFKKSPSIPLFQRGKLKEKGEGEFFFV
jgi:hypothetical protein